VGVSKDDNTVDLSLIMCSVRLRHYVKHKTQPFVTDVLWSVSVDHDRKPYRKVDPVEVPYEILTQMGPINHVLGGCWDPPGEAAVLGASPNPLSGIGNIQYVDDVLRFYSFGGSSDVAFCCQYSSNLF